jgi:2,4-dienoyl-CoA reductase-like NADH-dependent reductase (Old Yellow Enzyme family)
MNTLFDPIRVGELDLPNRIIMAPLTRCRASQGRVPNDVMRQYYQQRASAGLIITEATSISPMAVGYPNTPGIWTEDQVNGWRRVTEAVHQAGGQIVLQLWHVGRISDPIYLNGELPIAPSAIRPDGHVPLVRPQRPYVTPRALRLEEIAGIVTEYRRGAENALRAGFDGVELHGANGYLLDQFLQDGTNKRTDEYGGPIENRARLMLGAVDAAISIWGAGRVGLHLNPRAGTYSISDSDPAATFGYVAREVRKRGIAFICVRESLEEPRIGPELKKIFGGSFIANEGFTWQTASESLARGEADGVAFGKLFIANPDLVARFKSSSSLNEPQPETFYSSGVEGYIDYPMIDLAA